MTPKASYLEVAKVARFEPDRRLGDHPVDADVVQTAIARHEGIQRLLVLHEVARHAAVRVALSGCVEDEKVGDVFEARTHLRVGTHGGLGHIAIDVDALVDLFKDIDDDAEMTLYTVAWRPVRSFWSSLSSV